jgi:hypothetical protein
MKRLTVIVPYRNRESHLRQFVPHLQAYFTRDKTDYAIPYRLIVVEQNEGLPFNRGALKNIGYLLGRESGDYTCFHDVDYLPIWADYSYPASPTVLVWYGAQSRPIAPGRSAQAIHHDLDAFYGGAVLIPNGEFERVNGYANDYWGWGMEDMDLKHRILGARLDFKRRKGTYLALGHDHEGHTIDGSPTPIHEVNKALFEHRCSRPQELYATGLSDIAFEILNRREFTPDPGSRTAHLEMVTVSLSMRPMERQIQAL